MDYSFFALGLIGAFAGYIIGDFQRQSRYRRDARANLALANQRAMERAAQRAAHHNRDRRTNTDDGASPGTDDGNDGGTNSGAYYIDRARSGAARRRAISRPDHGPRVGRHAPGRDSGSADETSMSTATMVGLI